MKEGCATGKTPVLAHKNVGSLISRGSLPADPKWNQCLPAK